MQEIIIGYGYCGFFLAQLLTMSGQRVRAVSRHYDPDFYCEKMEHFPVDINQSPLPFSFDRDVLYYFAPPPKSGQTDTRLAAFLQRLAPQGIKRVIYCSSSGVYGNQQGGLVSEHTPVEIASDRQLRRLNAEQAWQRFCQQHHIPLVILRTAGIYGPGRVPLTACRSQKPLLPVAVAPQVNYIYVDDLARIAWRFSAEEVPAGIYNVADGNPLPLGGLQRKLADLLGCPPAPEQDFDRMWEHASAMKREFMQSSKRLSVDKLLQALPGFQFTTLEKGLHQSLQKELSL